MSHRSCSSGKSSVESAGLEIVKGLTLSPGGEGEGGGTDERGAEGEHRRSVLFGRFGFRNPPPLVRSDPIRSLLPIHPLEQTSPIHSVGQTSFSLSGTKKPGQKDLSSTCIVIYLTLQELEIRRSVRGNSSPRRYSNVLRFLDRLE